VAANFLYLTISLEHCRVVCVEIGDYKKCCPVIQPIGLMVDLVTGLII
jgi:hypothetical protein